MIGKSDVLLCPGLRHHRTGIANVEELFQRTNDNKLIYM